MSLALRYAERCGLTFDVAVNVLCGGLPGQTVSYRAALAQRSGQRWGCVLCWLLNYLVERDHCARQFTDVPSGLVTYLRAGAAFSAAGGIIAMIVSVVWRAVA